MALSLQTRVAFDALIVTVVAPELNGRGYRKHGLRWSRSVDKTKTSIRVQREARGRSFDEVSFTFRFEVRTPEVALVGGIGAFMPEPSDLWWRVHAGVLNRSMGLPRLEPDLIEYEIADAVSRAGDTIDNLRSTAAVRALAEQEATLVELGLLQLTERR